MIRMGKRRAVEVKAKGVGGAVLRGFDPQKARLEIDEAPDQPGTGDAIDPYPLPGGPQLAAIRSPLQVPDAHVQRLWFVRRKLSGDSSVCFGKGLGTLGLGGPREVVD